MFLLELADNSNEMHHKLEENGDDRDVRMGGRRYSSDGDGVCYVGRLHLLLFTLGV